MGPTGFSVDEKGRVRRYLESFQRFTVSKGQGGEQGVLHAHHGVSQSHAPQHCEGRQGLPLEDTGAGAQEDHREVQGALHHPA